MIGVRMRLGIGSFFAPLISWDPDTDNKNSTNKREIIMSHKGDGDEKDLSHHPPRPPAVHFAVAALQKSSKLPMSESSESSDGVNIDSPERYPHSETSSRTAVTNASSQATTFVGEGGYVTEEQVKEALIAAYRRLTDNKPRTSKADKKREAAFKREIEPYLVKDYGPALDTALFLMYHHIQDVWENTDQSAIDAIMRVIKTVANISPTTRADFSSTSRPASPTPTRFMPHAPLDLTHIAMQHGGQPAHDPNSPHLSPDPDSHNFEADFSALKTQIGEVSNQTLSNLLLVSDQVSGLVKAIPELSASEHNTISAQLAKLAEDIESLKNWKDQLTSIINDFKATLEDKIIRPFEEKNKEVRELMKTLKLIQIELAESSRKHVKMEGEIREAKEESAQSKTQADNAMAAAARADSAAAAANLAAATAADAADRAVSVVNGLNQTIAQHEDSIAQHQKSIAVLMFDVMILKIFAAPGGSVTLREMLNHVREDIFVLGKKPNPKKPILIDGQEVVFLWAWDYWKHKLTTDVKAKLLKIWEAEDKEIEEREAAAAAAGPPTSAAQP
ncbi:hypothetical protein SCHPADRAFT_947493, partial [Schizopora paradoxa]